MSFVRISVLLVALGAGFTACCTEDRPDPPEDMFDLCDSGDPDACSSGMVCEVNPTNNSTSSQCLILCETDEDCPAYSCTHESTCDGGVCGHMHFPTTL